MAFDLSMFQAIGVARANQKGDVFRDGRGLAVIEELIYDRMNDGITFVARMVIVESYSKGDLDPKTKGPVQPNAPGSHVGWPQKVDKHKSAAGNVKSFMLAAIDRSEAELDAEPQGLAKVMAEATSPSSKENLLRGVVMEYSTYQQQVRGKDQINTYVAWKACDPALNTKELIAKRREQLDKGEKPTLK